MVMLIIKNGKVECSRIRIVISLSAACLVSLIWCSSAAALIKGVCSDCHTMHNSQNNGAMNFDNSDIANDNLTKGDCLGCHAQGGSSATVDLGTSSIPQVMHTGATDLAGGNFGYITGITGGGAADNKGHNIKSLTGEDAVLYAPPGGLPFAGHDIGGNVNTENLTCAGVNGCHGYRYTGSPNPAGVGISGAHHKNSDGQLDQAVEPANSYRFLMGVKGFESSDWQENPSVANHNEYHGLLMPVRLGCGSGGTMNCHNNTTGVQPPDGTMSQFCATCHGNFHTLETGDSDGVGSLVTSPFRRHPTDLALPITGEYAAYTVYNLEAPVARITVPAAATSAVTPGSDVVMCLSCHVSHASDYPSMLRWDYTTMVAGNGGAAAGTGCFVCHTTKD
jgi:Doubled CXXCH motif (Paired_CXXCH_1)